MKVIVKFSSGTGNTKHVANMISNKLKELGHQTELSDIETPTNFVNFDMLVIGGPIYAGNLPEKLIKYVLHQVPASPGTKAIVFTTSAGLINANGVDSISSKLNKKSYDVVLNEKFILPRNYYFGSYSPMEDEYCKELFRNASRQIDDLVTKIHTGNFNRPDIVSKGILAKDLFAELFSVMAKFMGKSFRANQNCTLCLKCVKNCPQANIKKTSKGINYGFNCMMCTRCIHGCPANAIEYGKKTYKQYKISNYI